MMLTASLHFRMHKVPTKLLDTITPVPKTKLFLCPCLLFAHCRSRHPAASKLRALWSCLVVLLLCRCGGLPPSFPQVQGIEEFFSKPLDNLVICGTFAV